MKKVRDNYPGLFYILIQSDLDELFQVLLCISTFEYFIG